MRVANGNVRGFTNDGIRTIAQYLSVSDMLVTSNGRIGIYADIAGSPANTVSGASIANSKATSNGYEGIRCDADCRVENSLASKNGDTGITFTGIGGLALGNIANSNTVGSGIYFGAPGGAGNNTAVGNGGAEIGGDFIALQPNACDPACLPVP